MGQNLAFAGEVWSRHTPASRALKHWQRHALSQRKLPEKTHKQALNIPQGDFSSCLGHHKTLLHNRGWSPTWRFINNPAVVRRARKGRELLLTQQIAALALPDPALMHTCSQGQVPGRVPSPLRPSRAPTLSVPLAGLLYPHPGSFGSRPHGSRGPLWLVPQAGPRAEGDTYLAGLEGPERDTSRGRGSDAGPRRVNSPDSPPGGGREGGLASRGLLS